jgi:GntR family transcriptional regulator
MRRTGVGSHDSAANFTARGHSARRLRDLLRSSVLRGYFPDGALPSEAEMMRTHRVSRGAVRDALNMLREEGLVSRVQGMGTFVVSPAVLSRMVEIHGMKPVSVNGVWDGAQRPEILDCSVVPTPEAVAARVQPTVSATCLRVEYVATVAGEAMGMACNYVTFPEAQALLEVKFETDWYAYLRSAGLAVGSSEFLIGCASADVGVAKLLDLPSGRAILTLEQLICDRDGRPFNVAFCASRSDRFGLVSIAVSEHMRSTASQAGTAGGTLQDEGPNRSSERWLADSEPDDPTDWYSSLQQSKVEADACEAGRR